MERTRPSYTKRPQNHAAIFVAKLGIYFAAKMLFGSKILFSNLVNHWPTKNKLVEGSGHQ